MENKNLLKRLSLLGFPLLEAERIPDANAALLDMAKSKNTRVLEGFPVVLANSAQEGLLNFDKLYPNPLVIMSLALYKALNLKFWWIDKLYLTFSIKQKKELADLAEKFKQDENFKLGKWVMSAQRLKTAFNNYFVEKQARLNDLTAVKDELSLEYALSQVFSPKQKELFLKKLRREKLTKTEREYFSRTVKKKVLALANIDLHRLAQRAIE